MVKVHEPFGAKLPEQSFVSAKWPLRVMDDNVTLVACVLLSVAVCGWLVEPGAIPANVSEVGLKTSSPVEPVAINWTDWFPPGASSENVMSSVFIPAEVGRNASDIVHDAPAGIVVGAVGQVDDRMTKSWPMLIE